MNNIKNHLRKISWIPAAYHSIEDAYYRFLTILSPSLNTKARYKQAFQRKLELDNPQTFNEKLLKIKIEDYNNNPLVKQCADKYRVRDYVESAGCGDILVPLIAHYDKAKQIEWEKLPNAFAIKWNFGCGFNIIVSDKSTLDIPSAVKQLNKWGKDKKCYLDYAEMQYKDVKKRIIVEQHLMGGEELPADYKVYCFHGVPRAILFMNERNTDNMTALFMDTEWQFLSFTRAGGYKRPDELPAKPVCLQQMLECSRKLSKPFPFVRVDFYVVGTKLYFGELTFTPGACIHASQCKIDGKDMGEFL